MRSQYYYEPPRSNWLENLRFLIEPPTAYISFLGGIGLALILLMSPEFSRYGANILVLLIAFPIHELSHALVADRLGDATPRLNGRITLNPFAQLNLIGSILMIIVGLGWAYVPINPNYLRPNPRTGHMLVAIAGPISNLILAVLCAGLWHLFSFSLQSLEMLSVVEYLYRLLFWFCFINLGLFFFNLIPIFPLDGFAVLKGLLPYELAYQLERMQQYGMLIFLGLFFIAPLMGLPILNWLVWGPAENIAQFLFWGV